MYFSKIDTIWNDGVHGKDYFPSLAYYRHLVESLYRDIAVDPADADAVAQAIEAAGSTDTAETRIVVVTEDWCGDSAVTVPYIARLAEAVGVELRIFRQSVFTELKRWYEEDGATHIPTVSVIHGGAPSATHSPAANDAPSNRAEARSPAENDAPLNQAEARSPAAASDTSVTDGPVVELFRWIERPADAHGNVKQWVADHPEFTELRERKDDDPTAEKEYFKLYAKLLRDMAAWYRRGLWRSIAAEFAAGICGN